MAVVTVRLDTSPWLAGLHQLKERVQNQACARVITRATNGTRVFMARAVAQDLQIKTGDANKAITTRIVRTPDRSVSHGEVIATGARIPLMAFAARGQMPSRGRGRGVTANTGGGRKLYPGTFIAKMQSGHIGVFERATNRPMTGKSVGAWSKNLPIEEKFGASVPQIFDKHMAAGVARGEELLMKNMAHEIEFELSRLRA